MSIGLSRKTDYAGKVFKRSGRTQSVTVALASGQDGLGQVTYAAGTAQDATVREMNDLVTDEEGREVLAAVRVTFYKQLALTVSDKITLADGSSPRIIRVDHKSQDQDGNSHLTIAYLGSR